MNFYKSKWLLLLVVLVTSCKKQDETNKNLVSTETTMINEPINCKTLTDFTNQSDNDNWRTVNDNVMGGRSKGGMEFKGDTMVYSGFINTNGGGFSSIRLDMDNGFLEPFKSLKFKVRSTDSDLSYRIIFEDKQRSWINYGSPLKLQKTGDWQEIEIPLDSFKPYRRGEILSAPVFKKENVGEIGFIVSHTVDSNFKLEVDWIQLCE